MRFAPLSRSLSGADHPCPRRRPVLNSRKPGDFRSESRGAAGWLLGGTAISTISRRHLVLNAG
jgi:hypothetical protein